MSRHRAEPPRRRAGPPPSRHRDERVHPRYGRVAVLGASLSVVGIAMLGGVGVLPSVTAGSSSGASGAAADTALDDSPAGSVLVGAATDPSASPSQSQPPATNRSDGEATGPAATTQSAPAADPPEQDPPVPADSGTGKRIVFDEGDQRVWLVAEDGTVARTYLVSGSVYDNLDPGIYSVYSRSEQAYGIDDSGTMKYFVRFTEGDNGAAIGFHDIPVDEGALVQSVAQLGTPLSHGCIRQERDDAIALWEFAPIGTEVVVTA